MSELVICGVAWLVFAAPLYALAKWSERTAKKIGAVKADIDRTLHPLVCMYSGGLSLEAQTVGGDKWKKRGYIVAVTPEQIAFYHAKRPGAEPCCVVPTAALRWFGRPHKYRPVRKNELRLHAEMDGHWVVVRLWLNREPMRKVVRALKEIAPEQQIIAYRRRRPYIHAGPVPVHPAQQDLQGVWTLDDLRQLYLTPEFLVLLDGEAVQQVFPLAQVQRIAAIQRLDQPGAAGLLRFEFNGEPRAFAMPGHEQFAGQMAEAAKRTLEDPVQWQRKKKKADPWSGEPVDEDA